jgi:hypothetical protein
MSDIETFLAEVEGRRRKATPGPMEVKQWNFDDYDANDSRWQIQRSEDARVVCAASDGFCDIDNPNARHDATFCAEAYADVPRLLQIVRAQQTELATMRAEKQVDSDLPTPHASTKWCRSAGVRTSVRCATVQCPICGRSVYSKRNGGLPAHKIASQSVSSDGEAEAVEFITDLQARINNNEKPTLLDVQQLMMAFYAMQAERDAMRAEKQAVIDGMTRAITAEGDANRAFYAMQAERDKLEAELIRCLRDASEVLANLHNVESERDALRERVEKLESLGTWIEAERLNEIGLATKAQDGGECSRIADGHYSRADGLKFVGYKLNELAGRDVRK